MTVAATYRKSKTIDLTDHKNLEELAQKLRSSAQVRCLVNELLSKHTSYKVGGPASLYVYPTNESALSATLKFCIANSIQVFIIGFGTNLLVSDEGFKGCVIDLKKCCATLEVDDDMLTVGSAVCLNDAVKFAAESGLGGNWDKLAGISGGVGGALVMNAGAFRASISDYLIDIDVMDYDGEMSNLSKNEVGFDYRSASALRNKIVLKARFKLPHRSPDEAIRAMEDTIAERHRRNVMVLPSAGSVFKNPSDHFAAKLIESLGGKGMRVGKVRVSPDHANIIVNDEGGSAGDIAALIIKLKQLVHERHDIELEMEVKAVGFPEGWYER